MIRALLAAAVFASSCTTTNPPAPVPNPPAPPAPAPVRDASPPSPAPAATCDDFGAQIVCIAFETGTTPGALVAQVDATCTSSGVAAAQALLVSLDSKHQCIGQGAKK